MRGLTLYSVVFSMTLGCTGNRAATGGTELGVLTAADVAGVPAAPVAKVVDAMDELHGTKVADPYRWLEDVKSAETQAWMNAQDAAARARLARLPGRDALAKRFRALYYVDSVSPPVRRAGRFFYVRTHADREKGIVYWREGEDGPEKALIDPNGWSEDGTVSLGRWVPSWDGKRIAYQRKENAADEATLYVLEVDTGAVSKTDVIAGGKYAEPSWTPDSKAFYYEWLPTDAAIPVKERPGYCELRKHVLGTDPRSDAVVYPRTGDPKTFLGGGVSRDGRFELVYVQRGWNENDVWIKELGKDAAFRLLVAGRDATYGAEFWGDSVYVLTNEGAPRSRLFKAPADRPERANWREIVAEDPEATLEDARIIGGRLVLTYLRSAASELRVTDLDGKPATGLELPGIGVVSGVYGNPDEPEAYYAYSSFTTPQQVYAARVDSGATRLWARVALPIDPSPYVVEQVRYPSKDGTLVSMFLVHRRDAPRDGSNPVLLYGYGGFNVSLGPNFRSSIYPWLEAGGVYAVPNLRGGGEYGKAWHDAGKGAFKQNVFDDFAAAAEYLVRENWTRPGRLAIYGGSNGGLLVGAAMTQHPELYGAVVCAVPLLDMVRYHLFGSGQTWIPEYGSADDATQFRTLLAYSPYHRVVEGARYPPLLMLSADNDDRVDPLHARKFVARVQAAGAPVALLRVEKNAGHGGADQVKKAIEASSDLYAFLFATLGVPPPAGR
jgi:prolyl oligopeptidase